MIELGESMDQDGIRMVTRELLAPRSSLLTHGAPCAAISSVHVDGIRTQPPAVWDVGMAPLGFPMCVPAQD